MPDPSPTPTSRRWLITLGKGVLVLLVVAGVAHTAREGIAELREISWQLRPAWLVLGGLLYLAGLLPSAVFWHRVLGALGQRPRWFETFRAYYIGHLGKYVPGKALVVILRTALIRSRRVDTPVAVLSVFYETLTMMAIGAAVAAAVLMIRFREQQWLAAVALGLMLLAGLPTVPAVFAWIVRLLRLERFQAGLADSLKDVGWRGIVAGWLGIAAGWCVIGGSLAATLRGLDAEVALDDLPLCIASASLAVVAGFLSLIPGGAVVREAVILELMAPRFGAAVALLAAVAVRFVWLLAEVAVSVILYYWPSGQVEDSKDT